MVDVRMPDGQVVRFPDDLTDQQIGWLIKRKYPGVLEAVEQLGAKDLADRYAERGRSEGDIGAVADDSRSFDPVGSTLPVESVHDDQPLLDRGLYEPASAERDEGMAAREVHELLARLSSHIDRAKLLTALIKANGGRPLR